ncbi:MAG: discoidin domain-containing protein [Phycisphaerales bacterium]
MCRKLVSSLIVLSALAIVSGQAQGSPYDRVAYWDSAYATSWAGDGIAVRDALQAAGYTVVNAAELKTWMDARIADRKLSVVVFCRDDVPATVAETNNANATIRQYLNAGGKVVWYADIPFYYQANSTGGTTNWGTGGSTNILGFNGAGGTWDAGGACTITETGTKWGLTTTWTSSRPAAGTGIDNFEILATDKNGNAPAYVKHYLPGDTFRGFVRIDDKSGAPINIPQLIAVAEYAESIATAMTPSPETGATDVHRDVSLSWTAGEFAAGHNVYLGTSFEDVNAASVSDPRGVLVSQNQTELTYDPEGMFQYGQTYYWRIDEVNAAPTNTVFKGEIWKFTVEPVGYPITKVTATASSSAAATMGPEKTSDGSGLNADDQHSTEASYMWMSGSVLPAWIQYQFDAEYKLHQMWVWNANQLVEGIVGFGAKDVVVEYSVDGATWTTLEGASQFARATGMATYGANTTVDFNGAIAKYVRITINSNWGGMTKQTGLSEVRFFYVPVLPREPQPADNATNVVVGTDLTWRTGREAASHKVYVGTDKQAVADGAATVKTAGECSVTPGDLIFASTYYWKVVEVNAAETTPEWAGSVWTFATEEFGAVEDFESYNDDMDAGTTIWNTWIDGVTDKASGSQVGYTNAPFAEKSIVHGGKQAMPLLYNNTQSPYYSEAYRTFDTPQDWTPNGADMVRICFRGNDSTINAPAPIYMAIEDSSGKKLLVANSDPNATVSTAWQSWLIPMSTFTNAGVKMTKVKTITIGVGNKTSPSSGGSGTLYIDDIGRGTSLARRTKTVVTASGCTVRGVPNDGLTTSDAFGWPAAEAPAMVFDGSSSTKFLHFKGEKETTGVQVTPAVGPTVVDEIKFVSANDAAERDPISFELYGSNGSITGPYTLITKGDIVDFAGATAWARLTATTTPITFANTTAYAHYQVLFPKLRTPATANSMQIAEIQLIGIAK